MVYFPSLFGYGPYGIPTSYRGVEAYSPLTPVSNYLWGIDSYGLGSFGIGAGSMFGILGSPAPFGIYGRFYDTPSFVPIPYFMPQIPWLVSTGNTDNVWRPPIINPADFINFASPQETSGASVNEIDEAPKEVEETKKKGHVKKKRKPATSRSGISSKKINDIIGNEKKFIGPPNKP